jgi:hypothetical protein
MIAAVTTVSYGTYITWATIVSVLTAANMVFNWRTPSRKANEEKFATKTDVAHLEAELDILTDRFEGHIDRLRRGE